MIADFCLPMALIDGCPRNKREDTFVKRIFRPVDPQTGLPNAAKLPGRQNVSRARPVGRVVWALLYQERARCPSKVFR